MILHHLSEKNSVLNHFLSQIRDIERQKDSMRFRKNMERIGEIMAYEMSKQFSFVPQTTTTPLGEKATFFVENPIVICSVLRAGLALHTGFTAFFDAAENGYISAYRHHFDGSDTFEIVVQYKAVPSFADKNRLMGGIFGGHSSVVSRWLDAFKTVTSQYIQCGWFIGKDQSVMNTACLRFQGLCHFVGPSLSSRDPWHVLKYYILGDS